MAKARSRSTFVPRWAFLVVMAQAGGDEEDGDLDEKEDWRGEEPRTTTNRPRAAARRSEPQRAAVIILIFNFKFPCTISIYYLTTTIHELAASRP
jgi:hypothetical protein